MPVHRVPTDDCLERCVSVIELKERIVSVVPAGAGAVLVFTEKKVGRPKSPEKETR